MAKKYAMLFLIILSLIKLGHCQMNRNYTANLNNELDELKVHNYSGRIGGTVHLNCYDYITDIARCRILDNRNQFVTESCTFIINSLNVKHFGIWKCEVTIKNKLFMSARYLKINQIRDIVEQKQEEYDDQTFLQCTYKWKINNEEVPNREWKKSWCRAQRPDQTWFMFPEQLFFSNRYETNTYQHPQCDLKIQKPFDSKDYGTWRLEMGISEYDYTGCIFNVPKNQGRTFDNNETYIQEQPIYIEEGSLFELRETSPWPVKYCSVSNTLYSTFQSLGGAAERLKMAGVCLITISKTTSDMSGNWLMTVKSYDNRKRILNIPVFIQGKNLVPDEEYIKTIAGENVVIMFRVPNEYSIGNKECILTTTPFVDPREYTVTSSHKYYSIDFAAKISGKWILSCQIFSKKITMEYAYVTLNIINQSVRN